MKPDNELLGRYIETHSEEAFAELVRRHVNLVYSAALRQVNGDMHLAQEVAQSVFTDLARKSGSLAHRQSLTGWLYTSAHFAAAKIMRTESRRRNREDRFMRESLFEIAADADWGKIRPALDEAMHELKESDREAILLRYFENQPFADVGARLGLNENAARMRVDRALEKLRAIFARRGITATVTLASVISANAVQTAPAGLVAALTASSAAAAGTGSILALSKFMTATYLKIGVSTLVVAGAATAMVLQHQNQIRLRDQSEALRRQIAQLETNNQSLSNRLASMGQAKSLKDEQFNELLRLRGEVGSLRSMTNELKRENQRLQILLANSARNAQPSEENISGEEQQRRMAESKMSDAKVLVMGEVLYAREHQGQLPKSFRQFASYVTNSVPALTETNTFNLVYHGALDSLTNPSSVILIREYAPWPTYNGKWARTYGFADGHCEVHTEPYDNFDAFEQQHRAPSPQNQ